jgi:hypothetical protein
MKSKGSIHYIIAVAFAASLILCSRVQARNLLGLGADLAPRTAVERPVGLLQQMASWLTDTWTELKVALASDTTTPPPTTQGCDAGWGLDPEGCPNH